MSYVNFSKSYPRFSEDKSIESKHPYLGFYYLGVYYNSLPSSGLIGIIRGDVGTDEGSRTAPRVLPSIRLCTDQVKQKFDIFVNFKPLQTITYDTISLKKICVCWFDLTAGYVPSDTQHLTEEDLKHISIAFSFDATDENGNSIFLSNRSNIMKISDIAGDIRRVPAEGYEVFTHLESYTVDKQSAFSKVVTDNQFLEKVSAIKLAGEVQYEHDRPRNGFDWKASGVFDF